MPEFDLMNLVLTWASVDLVNISPPVLHLDLVTLVRTWASRVTVTLVLSWASSGLGDTGPHLAFTWIW